MGPYATAHLDDAAWRHGVLKCLFVGVPLAAVDGLETRRDDELVRMVRAFADERTAAGRDFPADGTRLLAGPEGGAHRAGGTGAAEPSS
ncbi:EboA domain-containing protein [Georgenia sp. SUBG003]|uniref:EboA domain-containing protein n=1 Tax=Georgenia sp. SUBG003 TaxID=1497974 RepID=UPI00069444E6